MALEDLFPALFDGYFIKIVFLFHSMLLFSIGLAIETSYNYITTFTVYNLLFLISLQLSVVCDKNVDIVLLTVMLTGLCIVFDFLLLLMGFASGFWAILLVVINLIFRPISGILLLKNYSARAGVEDPTRGILEVDVPPRTYQNIDQPSQNLP